MSAYVTLKLLKDALDEKLAPLRSEISELREKFVEAVQFLDLTNEKYEEVLKKLETHEAEHKEIITKNKILKSTVQSLGNKVEQLKETLNEMEQYSRRECLEIQGIPASSKVEMSSNKTVVKIGELMGIDIDEDDISVSHRLPVGSKYKGKTQDPKIIVKFIRRDVKEQFYRSRKKLKNVTTQHLGYSVANHIYINESLTEMNKELFRDCLKAKKDLNFTYIWTSNGKIYMRKDQLSQVIHIRNKNALLKLLQR